MQDQFLPNSAIKALHPDPNKARITYRHPRAASRLGSVLTIDTPHEL
jgi:hypothetical protein